MKEKINGWKLMIFFIEKAYQSYVEMRFLSRRFSIILKQWLKKVEVSCLDLFIFPFVLPMIWIAKFDWI